MAAHSSIPAWRIPWMEEPGGLQSTESLSTESLLMKMAGTEGQANRTRYSLLCGQKNVVEDRDNSKAISAENQECFKTSNDMEPRAGTPSQIWRGQDSP